MSKRDLYDASVAVFEIAATAHDLDETRHALYELAESLRHEAQALASCACAECTKRRTA
jgi:uncharacterized protein YllA (UPF0747 family)